MLKAAFSSLSTALHSRVCEERRIWYFENPVCGVFVCGREMREKQKNRLMDKLHKLKQSEFISKKD